MQTEIRKLSKIIPYENNPRLNDGAVEAVAESIRQCGYIAPIIVDENGVILAGHTRHKALKKLGYKEVPVVVKAGLTEEQKKKYRLLDNKTAELADWDFDALKEEIEGLDFEGFDFHFDFPEDMQFKPPERSGAQRDDSIYTSKTSIPQYTPSETPASLDECLDRSKTDHLLAEIEHASIAEDEKEFLRAAAMRHLDFSYKKIADYYAGASEEMQRLMEESALVIIDFDDAIKNGYAELRGKVMELFNAEQSRK